MDLLEQEARGKKHEENEGFDSCFALSAPRFNQISGNGAFRLPLVRTLLIEILRPIGPLLLKENGGNTTSFSCISRL